MLTGLALVGLAIATLAQSAFAQSDPFAGVWQLNLAKSKYSPGPPPKSGTLYIHGEGQNRRDSVVAIDAQGNPTAGVLMHIYDGQPHPVTGLQAVDAAAYTRADANTLTYRYTKAGNVVSTGTITVSQDGKTLTIAGTGTNANGQATNNITLYDKQ
jgi:YD repeat-containing protein